jgi:hypothetical protein
MEWEYDPQLPLPSFMFNSDAILRVGFRVVWLIVPGTLKAEIGFLNSKEYLEIAYASY